MTKKPTLKSDAAPINEPQAAVDPAPIEVTPELLALTAQSITDMLSWRSGELLDRLKEKCGLTIQQSIAGTEVAMLEIRSSTHFMGQAGIATALQNWANAARRQVLKTGTPCNEAEASSE